MISIIIPTLNEERVIATTLKKLKSGLTLPYEIIVSDGKSTDNTVSIAGTYTDKVIAYTKPERQTIAQGRNAGAQAALGEFLVYFDADCFVENPQMFFSKAISLFQKDPTLVGLTTKVLVSSDKATLLDKIIFSIISINLFVMNNIFRKGAATGEFQMIRTSAFKEVGGYRDHLVVAEDNDLFYRLSKIGRTKISLDLVVYHSGRRAHTIGWFKLLWLWAINGISLVFRDKTVSKEWKVIR